MSNPWYGVDLDGTLAEFHGWQPDKIGAPVTLMAMRVRKWLAEDRTIKIVTARVAATGRTNDHGTVDDQEFADRQRAMIEDWTLIHFGQRLEVTCSKDMDMAELWDDRCVRVEKNTGRIVSGPYR